MVVNENSKELNESLQYPKGCEPSTKEFNKNK